ncbi:MAG TPA: DUF4157 domain-containing protein [Duganella sp.]|uniref:eCIS core domain-containing protein n=1 Tax=Duganella sp. TaxID=1904440 RepID=UPI002ED2F017
MSYSSDRAQSKAGTAHPAERPNATASIVDQRASAAAHLQLKQKIAESPIAVASRSVKQLMIEDASSREAPANNTGLPDDLKAGIENLSGMGMGHVKVHYNSSQPAQLQARAYAQGSDIHVGPGQEQHLPHEAWHVVQQAQGRVKPTTQMNGRNFASASVVQRLTTNKGYEFPDSERDDLDAFLDENGIATPLVCSLADYNILVARHAQLALQIPTQNEVKFRSPEGKAYEALVDFAVEIELTEDKPAWTAAINQAADAYEANPAIGQPAAVVAAWPGRVGPAMPAGFAAAVNHEITSRALARTAQITAAYQAYLNDERLNPGAIQAIKLAIPHADIATVNTRLEVVYARQCNITRLNWLEHLGMAGGNTNPPNSPPIHYTKFNDALAAADDITNLRVDQRTVEELCNELFVNHIGMWEQLHATVVVGRDRYHRYWSGFYGYPRAEDEKIKTKLDAEYDRMCQEITSLVTEAKNRHGRVARNRNGQQTSLNVGP